MSRTVAAFLVVICVVGCVAGTQAAGEVKLGVYVESFCPYCQNFQTTTLKTVLATPGMLSIINMTLVPFGNAVVNQGGSITCQHGPEECVGNTIECCAIKHNPSVEKYWPFVLCMESHGDNMLQYKEQCAQQAGIDWAPINTCYQGPEGHACDLQAAKMTPANHQYVPWVVVNGKQLINTNNLLWEICHDYTGPNKPKACDNLPPPQADDDADDDAIVDGIGSKNPRFGM